MDRGTKQICIIKVARTRRPQRIPRANIKKMGKYSLLLHALRRASPQYENYFICILGAINELQWCQQLTELGMDQHRKGQTIQQCIAESIRGTQNVAR